MHTFLGVLAQERSRDAFLALVRSAVADEAVAAMLREFVTEALLTLVAGASRRRDARLRAALAASQLVGFAVLRHVALVDPLVGASDDEVAALVAPLVAQLLA